MKWIASTSLLALFAMMSFTACNTKDELPPGEDNLFYVKFDVGSDSVYYEDGVANYGNGPGVDTYSDSAGTLHSQFSTFIRSALDPDYEHNIITFQMVKFLIDSNDLSYNTRFLLFDEGTYNYGSWSEDSTMAGVDGAIITYTDNTGKIWSSDKRYGQQESWASFEITSHTAVDDDQFGAKTKGTFHCRVFDGTGGFLELSNGSFHARTIYQQQ